LTPVVIVAFVAAGSLYALDRLANRIVRPVPRPPARNVADIGLEHESFLVESGPHRLAAWLLRGGKDAQGGPLFILAHGWGASHETVLRLGAPLAQAGQDVLFFDMRGHGRNAPVDYVTVRQLRDDVSAVVAYAAERFPERPLVLVGHSFGGAASVLAAAEGSRVAAVALVAAPADIVEITSEYLTSHGLPGGVLSIVLRPFWWWRLGGSFVPHSPERRLAELDVPVAVIHPENDQRVHRAHAERLATSAGVELQIVADHEHTDVLEAPETLRLVLGLAEGLRAPSRERA